MRRRFFVSSFNGSDVAAIMTRDLYEAGDITDDQRTIFVSYQYAASACITNNTINCGAPIIAFCPIALESSSSSSLSAS